MSPTVLPGPWGAYPGAGPVIPPIPPITRRPVEPATRPASDREQRYHPDPNTPRIVQLIQLSAREYAEMLARLTEQQEAAQRNSRLSTEAARRMGRFDGLA